jgi:Icc-related predicted phosphoesterase
MSRIKILAVTDQVVDSLHSPNVKQRFGDVDFVISCGDLPYGYLDYLATVLSKPLYFVHGNHDKDYEYTEEGKRHLAPEGAISLDMQSVTTANGLILAGLEGSIRYDKAAGHQYTQEQMDRRATQLAARLLANRLQHGRYLDIFVAHSPPWGVGDGPDPAHVGFRSFITLIERFKPHLMLHGHQHRYYGPYGVPPSTQVGATRVINVYPYQLIEWEDDRE